MASYFTFVCAKESKQIKEHPAAAYFLRPRIKPRRAASGAAAELASAASLNLKVSLRRNFRPLCGLCCHKLKQSSPPTICWLKPPNILRLASGGVPLTRASRTLSRRRGFFTPSPFGRGVGVRVSLRGGFSRRGNLDCFAQIKTLCSQ